jgi:hypothetical protein
MGQVAKRLAQHRFSRDGYGGAVFRLFTGLREKDIHAVEVPRCVLTSMATAIGDDGAKIAGHAAPSAQQDAEVADLRSRLAAVQADAAELRATMGALKQSTSWRVTVPLRMAKNLLNPMRKRSD